MAGDDGDDDDDVEPIYFKEPSQLLQIFSALEERNLFLIQNSQETEEALEDLKNKSVATAGDDDDAALAVGRWRRPRMRPCR